MQIAITQTMPSGTVLVFTATVYGKEDVKFLVDTFRKAAFEKGLPAPRIIGKEIKDVEL